MMGRGMQRFARPQAPAPYSGMDIGGPASLDEPMGSVNAPMQKMPLPEGMGQMNDYLPRMPMPSQAPRGPDPLHGIPYEELVRMLQERHGR
jgi:hypothetical protein